MRHAIAQSSKESPFLDLLKSAESYEVHELVPSKTKSQLENFWRNFQVEKADQKAFLITVKEVSPQEPPQKATSERGPIAESYLLHNAELLLESKEYVLARNLFSFVLKNNLKEPRALKGLGVCLSRLGQTTSAKKCFKALWELHHQPEALFELGLCYVVERQDELALVYFKKVSDPSHLREQDRFEFFKEMGNCQTRSGYLEEAERSYREALKVIPASDAIYVNLGTLDLQRNFLEGALDNFRQAIELNPKNAKAFCGIGLVALQKGQRPAARESFHNALELDPMNFIALHQLVSLGDFLGYEDKVKHRLETFLAKEPKNTDMRYALAVLLFKEGQWLRCEKEVDAILLGDKSHVKARALKSELSSTRHQPKLR